MITIPAYRLRRGDKILVRKEPASRGYFSEVEVDSVETVDVHIQLGNQYTYRSVGMCHINRRADRARNGRIIVELHP